MEAVIGGAKFRYSLDGPSGRPVVMLSHSLAANLSMWDPQMDALTSRFRVLRYDVRGHGGSDAPAGAYSLEQLAEDAQALMEALGIGNVHFIGLSMGGMIGQTLALAAPARISSLVLCDTSSRVPPEAKSIWDERIRTALTQGMEPLVEPTIERWFTPPFRELCADVVNRVRNMIRATPPAGYVGCCHAVAALDLTDKIGSISLPSLVIVGEEDPSTPVEAARAIHERISGSELEIIHSAAHLSNIEQSEKFNRILTGFLERVAD